VTVGDRAAAADEIRRRFRKTVHRDISEDELSEAMRALDKRARDLPAEIARELAGRELRNLEARADLASQGTLGLLANLAGGGAGPLEELVASRDAIDALFARGSPERLADVATPAAFAAAVGPGVTLALPAGVIELGGALRGVDPFPSDVSIAGAGMDATLIVLPEAWSSGGAIERLTLRDCTVHVGGSRLFDRPQPASIRLERVRLAGFDHGASTAGIFAGKQGLALDARECRFEGGYGTVPGSGALFAMPNAALVARFEGCRFERMSAGLARLQVGVTLRFERCAFDGVLDDPARDAEGRRGVRLVDCEISRFDLAGGRPEPRSLDRLFADWERRAVR
jgi:hypothetical protein